MEFEQDYIHVPFMPGSSAVGLKLTVGEIGGTQSMDNNDLL